MPDLWVFGYGSLMWRPGFPVKAQFAARLHGYHRSFCVFSHVHRGTPETPGLVFGLDRGGACRGLAFQVDAAHADETRRYLMEREQVTSVYLDVVRRVRLLDDVAGSEERARDVEALCFIVDRQHPQYAGKLPFERQVELIAHGSGQSGKNPEYLKNTVAHLDEMGIGDAGLKRLWHAVEQHPRLSQSRR
ncbi:MAG: gamma-glutamylcyclotransferase [Parvibaculum sp.]